MKNWICTIKAYRSQGGEPTTFYYIVQARNADSAKKKAEKQARKDYYFPASMHPYIIFTATDVEVIDKYTLRYYRGERERTLKAIPYYEEKIKQFQAWLTDAKNHQAALSSLIDKMQRLV